MDDEFSYAEAFKDLDVEALKRDLIELMTIITRKPSSGSIRPCWPHFRIHFSYYDHGGQCRHPPRRAGLLRLCHTEVGSSAG